MTPLSPDDWPEYAEVTRAGLAVIVSSPAVYLPRIVLPPFGDRPPYDAEVCEALGVPAARWRVRGCGEVNLPSGPTHPFPVFCVEVTRDDGTPNVREVAPRWVLPVKRYLEHTSGPYRERVARALHAMTPEGRDAIAFAFDVAGDEATHAILLQLDADSRPGRPVR